MASASRLLSPEACTHTRGPRRRPGRSASRSTARPWRAAQVVVPRYLLVPQPGGGGELSGHLGAWRLKSAHDRAKDHRHPQWQFPRRRRVWRRRADGGVSRHALNPWACHSRSNRWIAPGWGGGASSSRRRGSGSGCGESEARRDKERGKLKAKRRGAGPAGSRSKVVTAWRHGGGKNSVAERNPLIGGDGEDTSRRRPF